MNQLSRRNFTKRLALASAALCSLPTFASAPNSKYSGVQLGLNVPYSFGNGQMSADDILKNCLQLGVNALELRTQPVEVFLGAPSQIVHAKDNNAAAVAELRAWRKSAATKKAADFRKRYEDAGVRIEIVKVDRIFKMTDDELNYAFALAKELGGRAISTEITKNENDLARVGKFADQHQLMVGYHGHASTKPEQWERAFALAKFNGANVDIGHYIAGNHGSPIPFLQKHHARVTHVHIKDRKRNEGPNTPFGEGETPIAEVLRLIRDNKWPIQATIEFEYKFPKTSDRLTEIARALKYCQDALKG